MKYTFWLMLFSFLVSSCNVRLNKKTKDDLVIAPETEYRNLDTLTISAPKPDKMKTAEEFDLGRYNPSHTRINDLLHTKLNIRFDWQKEQVIGKATLRLKPHFYPTKTLTLDAKGFEINKVGMGENGTKNLSYEYDGQQIVIDLGREYKRSEEYVIFIDYVATPKASGGSDAITSNQGLFFIDPRDEDPDKPSQIWTQGETEHNSRWFPTIDKPNERTTQEMYLTVDDKYKTLSNGDLVSSTKNDDGTRTDYWNMTDPHAPYLFMVAVGDFAIVEDEWNGKKVEYFVEPEYEAYARRIFPNTPEMLTYFSDILGVEFPWQKYAQVVVRDFVSGAMENTTGVIFGEFVQGTERDLIDEMNNDRIVAHEMFHHWFGDLVTCESWANLTMNEGFANYSEYLWFDHKFGHDEAEFHLLNEMSGYLMSTRNGIHPLIHFGYTDKENMFDAHSYNKGGMVLHMLRNYVGDEAFFEGLKIYLNKNKFSDVEAHELRLVMEDLTGQDLNWFFNQWYFESGHPQLTVKSQYDDARQKVIIEVEQTQDPSKQPAIFQLPVGIDVYNADGKAIRHDLFIDDRKETFELDAATKPAWINFDADNVLLAEIEEEKPEEEYVFQLKNATHFADQYEAMKALTESDALEVDELMVDALDNDFYVIRAMALSNINITPELEGKLIKMATEDPHSVVRLNTLTLLANTGDEKYVSVAKKAMEDPSYAVVGSALEALAALDPAAATSSAKSLEGSTNPEVLASVGEIYAATGAVENLAFFEENWNKLGGFSAITFIENYAGLAAAANVMTMLNSAQKLQTIAEDMQTNPWMRYAALNGINAFHGKLVNSMSDATEEELTKYSEADATILAIIESIKAKESNMRLKAMYGNFPSPPAN